MVCPLCALRAYAHSLRHLCIYRYGNYVQYEVEHALDTWVDNSQLSAAALADFLQVALLLASYSLPPANRLPHTQDLLVPSAATTGTCSAAEVNSNVFTLVPLPSEHYQMCARTSLCQMRCADPLALFYSELNNTAKPSVTTPFAYAISAESPFFNPYATASSNSLYFIDQRIVALATRNQTLHPACRPCTAGCLAVVKTPWSGAPTFAVRTYCIPPPEALQVPRVASCARFCSAASLVALAGHSLRLWDRKGLGL
jgi:hypothetical protein